MSVNKMLTSAMAAEKLGFSANYIRRLLASGKIKGEKMGHDWILHESALKGIKRQRQPKRESEND